ncbi:MAG TPA: SRPBCC family protein [Lacunisphaera sp.]
MPQTIRLHRVLRTTPEKAYRAFLNPGALAKWIPPYGFTCQVHSLDAKVGGTFRMSFTNFGTGHTHSFGGKYLELVPNEKLCYTDKFDDPNLPGEMTVTVSLRKVVCGTEVSIEQAGIPDAIPAEMCYLGWQESLVQLANVVEPDIPNG